MTTSTDQHGLFLCNVGGFYLVFKSCLTLLFFRSNPQFGTGVRLAATLTWLLIVIGYSIVSPPRRMEHSVRGRPLQWIVIYLGLAASSLMWTTAGSLAVAAAYWAGSAADVATVYLLLRYSPVEENARRIMYGFLAGAAVVAMVAWFSPALDDMRLGNEDFLHPNLIGFQFAIATLIAAYLAKQKKVWAWVAVGFGVTMIRTLSKGAIVGFLFAGLYYLLRGMNISRKARIYVGLASIFVLMCFWGLLEAYLDLYTQGSNLETLTGRTDIWSQALDLAMERPWFGYGFDSFRWVVPPLGGFQPVHAHNDLIQQFFAYGLTGVVVAGGVYWAFYRQVRVSPNTALKSLAMAMLILVLVRGLVDTDSFELCFPLWLMTLLSISLARNAAPQPASVS